LLSVRETLPDEMKNNPIAYPDQSTLARCERFINLPQEVLELYDSEWTRLKTAR